MTPLLDFLDRHPIATGATGSGLGFASWLGDHLEIISGVVGKVGVISAGLLSFFTLCLFVETQMRRLFRSRDERRRHFRDEPFDDHLP